MTVGKLFIMEVSPPCRAVLLTAKALGIELEKVLVNVVNGENRTPEYLKMNPAHSVPTYLDNDGTAIGDSHAIMIYLVQKYGREDDHLYPMDMGKQALINHRLHFDSGNVFSLHVSVMFPMMMKGESGPSQGQRDAADRMYEILNRFLEGNKWVAGSEFFTIADFSLCTSVSALRVLIPLDEDKYPNINPWIKLCEEIPFFDDVNRKGQNSYTILLNKLLEGVSFTDNDE